ncbi:MAG: sulfatase-like hydrolase/transferase [Paludibacteraceae bacterium]|nr:sulfatase-like hydrolase/transferase [Paludibacteraceae bacterium]
MNKIKEIAGEPIGAIILNFLLVMAIYFLCRLFFFAINMDLFPDVTFDRFCTMQEGGMKFDISAFVYTNALYLLLMILPFKFRKNYLYQKITRWVFVITNSLAILVNNCDAVYFRFTSRRTTCTIFNEFQNDGNVGSIIMTSLFEYWYVTIFAIAMIFLLYKLYKRPNFSLDIKPNWAYYPLHLAIFCLTVYFSIIGMRGGFGAFTRPITLSNANQYVEKTTESAIVLNTPFCLFRTIGKSAYKNPGFFESQEETEKVYSPIHRPQAQGEFKPLNVVILIMESFGKEYTGFFNKDLENGTYKGYTPFLDSLMAESLTFDYSYSNGRKSIDAMPSILTSIPMFKEPYVLTPYYTNQVNSIASLLATKGYYSAFFHGAPNGSMGFQAFAKTAKFNDYFGMDDYPNKNDFDGTWAIWDEEFFQFFAQKMGEFKQPFVTSIFSASSHHPFRIPEKYEGQFPKGDLPIHQCIGYSDLALRRFFQTMSQYDWFENTLFVFSADHTNQVSHPEYTTDAAIYSIPIFFYQPNSDLKGRRSTLAQQTDILPSILGYLNYDQPFIAFGNDIITQSDSLKYNVNYSNGIYQIYRDNYLLQFDGEKTKAVYDFKKDRMLQNNLLGKVAEQDSLELLLKANIQQYILRMINDQLTVKREE